MSKDRNKTEFASILEYNILNPVTLPEEIIKNCSDAIIDKFGNNSFTLRKNLKGEEITITQTTKAERFIGVAAASILAREKVVEWFASNLGLPKGASEEVDKVIKNIMDNPEIEMKNIAKLHFKNVKRCLIK